VALNSGFGWTKQRLTAQGQSAPITETHQPPGLRHISAGSELRLRTKTPRPDRRGGVEGFTLISARPTAYGQEPGRRRGA
jgi:hypothetical protein